MRPLAPVLLAALLGCATAQLRAQAPAAPNTVQAASRELWLSTEGRYVRQWKLLGPMSVQAADRLAPPGQPTTLTDDASWNSQTTYGDVLDASAAVKKDGDSGFALATVERASAGDVSILLGGNVRGLWVNGAWNGGAQNSPAFVIDGTEVKARLAAGTNRILLRVERVDRPVLVTLRVVDPGFIAELPVFAPYIPQDPPGTLRVSPGTRPGPLMPILYEVVAPGGVVVADARHLRTQQAKFSTGGWADGPYEIRVSARDARNEPVFAYLPWFKGDVQAAAQRLLEAAARPGADGHLKMLADMVRDRQDDALQLHSPLMEYAELERERAGATGGARGGGFVRLAWTDETDGSTQFCRAYLPSLYPAGKPVPALLFLHGFNPPNPPYVRWWSVADRHNGVAERHGIIVLEPMGRGNTDYRFIGERDVLRCLREAQARFSIDSDRVYLTGESMGGNGTWMIASRYPQVFAAAAPVFGGWDRRVFGDGMGFRNPDATRPMERYLQEAQSSFAGAEGLLNVPLYVLHGDADPAVPVQYSRHGVNLLQRFGYDVRYREISGRGHEDLKARDEIADWLLEHQRNRAPREVRLRSYDLAGARAHWVEVTGLENPFDMIEARARVVDELTIRLDTKNVSSLVLTPPPELLFGKSYPRGSSWKIIWNGARHVAVPGKEGSLRLLAAGIDDQPGDKSPAREGRLSYFFQTPFALVIGTSAQDPALRSALEAKARAFIDAWQRWQHVTPRVFHDGEVTPEIAREYSLLLLGGADANKVSARIAPRLPLKVSGDAITLDGRVFPAQDAVVQMLYPHPDNAARYVLLVVPTSTAGLRFWNPVAFWHPVFGFPLLHWDWSIADGRHVPLPPGLLSDRGWIAAGVFNRHWRRDDRFVVLGDPAARANARLRQVPLAPPKPSAESLAKLAGHYLVDPGIATAGFALDVTLDGGALELVNRDNGISSTLEPESDTDFSVVGTGEPVSFVHDGAGRVTALQFNSAGIDQVAKRQP